MTTTSTMTPSTISTAIISTSTASTTTTWRRWPAEYELHVGCILLFPKPSPQTAYCAAAGSVDVVPTTEPQQPQQQPQQLLLLKNAQNAVLDVITAIVKEGHEDVYLFCDPLDVHHQTNVVSYLQERQLPFVVTFDKPSSTMKMETDSTGCITPIIHTTTSTTNAIAPSENVVYVMLCPCEDTWARDTGPTFVLDVATSSTLDDATTTRLIGLDWEFNAYGGPEDGCYWPCTLDEQIASRMIQAINEYHNSNSNRNWSSYSSKATPIHIQHETIAALILEGGSIHTDGEGTILTTKECLLHPNRNPNLTPATIEAMVLHATGCTKVIWLDHGLAYDGDTNGHIDNWACFVRPGHVVLAWTDDEEHDPINYQHCRESLTTLQNSTDAHNRSLTIHKLYLPSPPIQYKSPDVGENVMSSIGTSTTKTPGAAPTTTDDTYDDTATETLKDATTECTTTVIRVPGTQMAASYVNFYIANDAVIVPQFGNPVYDPKAIEVLQSLFNSNDVDDGTAVPTTKKQRTVVGIHSSRHILYGGGNIHCITQQIPQSIL